MEVPGLRGSAISANPATRAGSSASNYQALRSSAAAPSTVDGYYKYELPSRKAEAEEGRKYLRGMTSGKARAALMQTRALVNAEFDSIHLRTQEMLKKDGPEHRQLLEHMENSLNFNLDVTQHQYANAMRSLME